MRRPLPPPLVVSLAFLALSTLPARSQCLPTDPPPASFCGLTMSCPPTSNFVGDVGVLVIPIEVSGRCDTCTDETCHAFVDCCVEREGHQSYWFDQESTCDDPPDRTQCSGEPCAAWSIPPPCDDPTACPLPIGPCDPCQFDEACRPPECRPSVKGFYRESSYGKLRLRGDVTPILRFQEDSMTNLPGIPVLPPDTTSEDCYSYYLQNPVVLDIILNEVEANGYCPDQYCKVVLTISDTRPHDGGGCVSGVFVGGQDTYAAVMSCGTSTTLGIHELGHAIGLGHSKGMSCSGPVVWDILGSCGHHDRGDHFSTMSAAAFHHFGSWRKDQLGWLDPGDVLPVTGAVSTWLAPLERATAGWPLAVRVERPGFELWIDNPREIGYDARYRDNHPANDGALLRLRASGQVNAALLDMTPDSHPDTWSDFLDAPLLEGMGYADPDAGFRVEIESPASCPVPAPRPPDAICLLVETLPNLPPTAPQDPQWVQAGCTWTFSARFVDPDTYTCPPGDVCADPTRAQAGTGQSGHVVFEVCDSTGSCTTHESDLGLSGTLLSIDYDVIANDPTPDATYAVRAWGVDSAGVAGPPVLVTNVVLNQAPGTVLVSPEDDTPGLFPTATFEAEMLDPDGSTLTGSMEFEICTDPACGNVVVSQAGVTANPRATWAVPSPSPLVAGEEYFWRARATDGCGDVGPWSGTRHFSVFQAGWSSPPPLPSSLESHAVVTLTDGQLMILGGWDGTQTLDEVWFFDAHDESWTPGPPLPDPLRDHAATLMADGQVMVTGGRNDTASALAIARLFRPWDGTWSPPLTMNVARHSHVALRNSDGQVMVIGGENGVGPLAEAEVSRAQVPVGDPFDFGALQSMPVPRTDHAAVELADGRVFVLGGSENCPPSPDPLNPQYCTVVYDPNIPASQQRWSDGPTSPFYAVTGHSLTLLPTPGSNQVLAAGGWRRIGPSVLLNVPGIAVVDIDSGGPPVTRGLAERRADHVAQLLPDGNVLLAGGVDGSGAPMGAAEIFDVDARRSHVVTPLPTPVSGAGAATLHDGAVAIVAGMSSSGLTGELQLFEDASGLSSFEVSRTIVPRQSHRATALQSDCVLLTGGSGQPLPFALTEVYDQSTQTVRPVATMPEHRWNHEAVLLNDGSVLVIGGSSPTSQLPPDGFRYVPAADCLGLGTWATVTAPARRQHALSLLPDGRAVVTGGLGQLGPSSNVLVYDPSVSPDVQTLLGSLLSPRVAHEAVLLEDGRLLLIGGNCGVGPCTTAEMVTFSGGTFTSSTVAAPRAWLGHAASLLADGRVLVTGGIGLDDVFIFDPQQVGGVPWTLSDDLAGVRLLHRQVVLPTGQVLIVGGIDSAGLKTDRVELFDPSGGGTTWSLPDLGLPTAFHSATLLDDGDVLIVGDPLDRRIERYQVGTTKLDARRPSITSAPATATPGQFLFITGDGLWGSNGSEGCSGISRTASGAHPVVVLQRQDNEQLTPLPSTGFSDVATGVVLPIDLAEGTHRLRIIVNGATSHASVISVD